LGNYSEFLFGKTKIDLYYNVKNPTPQSSEYLRLSQQYPVKSKIAAAEEGQPYVKNDRYIEPNALRVFAHDLADIYIYFEIYNLTLSENQEDSKYTAYFIVHAETGKKIAQFKRPKAIQGNSLAHSLKNSG